VVVAVVKLRQRLELEGRVVVDREQMELVGQVKQAVQIQVVVAAAAKARFWELLLV
tara:strand:- start:71 stop:238 length:168 start_codon:yes stop_codon:yes gene_type:complete